MKISFQELSSEFNMTTDLKNMISITEMILYQATFILVGFGTSILVLQGSDTGKGSG
jgi:hypothetical protein